MRESESPRVGDVLLQLRGASRRYGSGEQAIYALRGIDLDICAGEMIALVGASGSGKSTLMNVLGCLDPRTKGVIALPDGIRRNWVLINLPRFVARISASCFSVTTSCRSFPQRPMSKFRRVTRMSIRSNVRNAQRLFWNGLD